MEGLEENQNNENVIYFSIIGGKITKRLKEHEFDAKGKQLSVAREHEADDKSKKTFIERYYSGIGGLIEKAFIKDGDFGYTMELRLSKAGNYFNLSLALNSSYARSILFRLPNIDTDKEVVLRPYNFEDKESGKKRVGITVIQVGCGWDSDKVPPFYTKENPDGMPEMVIGEDALGKPTYDSKERDKFLNRKFIEWGKALESFSNTPPAKPAAESLTQETKFAEQQVRSNAEKLMDENGTDADDGYDLPF